MPLLKISFSRLFAGAFIALFLLAGLTVSVNYFGMFRSFDNAILQFIYGARGPMLTNMFLVFTFMGDSSFILSVTALLGIIFFYKKWFAYFLLFSGTMFGSAVSTSLLKILAHRARPSFSPLIPENAFSFPSGHATLSVAFFGLIAYLSASNVRTRTMRVNIFFVWLFAVFIIGLSRLYLGVHYPTDILAGYLAGLFFLCFGIGLFERFAKKIPAE
jgi:undecaprenyl-diphosphatase